jgi:FKBP-type peptidyl-prolyl cis-trans isomerase (trigger factor)
MAERNVRLSLILDKIRENEPDCQLSDQEAFNMIKESLVKSVPAKDIDTTMKQISNNGTLQIMLSRLKEQVVLDYLVKSTLIIE